MGLGGREQRFGDDGGSSYDYHHYEDEEDGEEGGRHFDHEEGQEFESEQTQNKRSRFEEEESGAPDLHHNEGSEGDVADFGEGIDDFEENSSQHTKQLTTASHKINYNYDYEDIATISNEGASARADDSIKSGKGSSALIGSVGINLSMGLVASSTLKDVSTKTRSMKENP